MPELDDWVTPAPSAPPGGDIPASSNATAAYEQARDRWRATVERAKAPQLDDFVTPPSNGTPDEGTFLHPVKPVVNEGEPLAQIGGLKFYNPFRADVGERLLQYPGLALGQITDAGRVLGRVAHGEIDATSPEAVKAATDMAMMTSPTSPAAGTGAQIARRAAELARPPYTPRTIYSPTGAVIATTTPPSRTPNPDYVPPSPRLAAAQTAADFGAPLPAGLVGGPMTQALTQGSRSLPIIGAKIDQRVGSTIEKAGGAVQDIAENLSGGVPNRDIAGAQLRPSLETVIADNKTKIKDAYDSLRSVIDPDAVSPLPQTEVALKRILAERTAAGMRNPEAGLGDVINLAKNGASFNGLERQRSAVGEMTSGAGAKPEPHRGFIPADFDRLYAAMSGDMENTVRLNTRPGVSPAESANAWLTANGTAKQLIDRNKNVQKLLGIQTDERRVGAVINAAQGKTGNAKLLGELRAQMPKEDLDQIAGVALAEMGHNPATGEFSLAKFGTAWRKLGDQGKSWLFPDPAHRSALNGIANLDAAVKGSDKYINKSGTARAVMIGEGIVGAATLATAIFSGNIPLTLKLLGTAAGGYGLARVLGRPATASALRKWATTAATKEGASAPARQAAIGLAGRNLMTNLRDDPNFNVQ